MATPLVGNILQLCIVTPDMDATLEHFWTKLGVGPWRVYLFEPPDLRSVRVRGQDVVCSWRLAMAFDPGGCMYEVIQPVQGPSIYQEFLDIHGGGIHHYAVSTPHGFDETIAQFQQRGVGTLMQAQWREMRVAFLDTEPLLGTLVEIWDIPEEMGLPEPPVWYPHRPEA
jgi:hypothetical protein